MKTPFTFVLMALCAILSSASARSQGTYPGAKADSALVDSLSKVFTTVEIESEFPGGARAWLQYLNEHLVYPKKAVRKRIEGTVVLQFIVDKEGNISDLSALSGDPILAEAALKAMVDCPRWHPAMKDGRKVKSYKKQPVVFKLQAQ
ncbi:MAG TPA: energy transducer TonB [Puia sp.]|jgi:protein TonB|nr:energy transducer TonB [Puia sp.]